MHPLTTNKILSVILVILCFLAFPAKGMAQNKNLITLNAERMTLAQLIREVERQTDYLFVYDPNEIDIQSTVSAKVKNQAVQSVLNGILSAAEIKCIFKENNIILQRITSAKESRHIVSGTVYDTNGEPVVGANVLEKGTKNGVFTDSDGKFQIEVSKDAVLTISSIGFSQMEVPTSGKEDVRIVLKIDDEVLDDVIVIGYGTAKKRDYIGSVSTLKANDIMKANPASAESALQGMATGVQVNSGSGIPGAPQQVKVRGISSISSQTDPLWIIDGIPVQSSSVGKSFDGETGQSVLGMLNPNDVESIQVLKDAAATSIYGSRGSNGVILITTKSGSEGKARINVDLKSGISTWAHSDIGLADTDTWMQIADIAMKNTLNKSYDVAATLQNLDGITETLTTDEARKINTDWIDEISRVGSFYEANLSLSQGSSKVKTYSSLKYRKDNGNLKHNEMETIAGNIKLDYGVTDWANLTLRLAATYTDNDRIKSSDGKAGAGGWGQVNSNALPWFKVWSDTGLNGYWNSLSSCNPLASMDPVNSKSNLKTLNLLSGITAMIKLPIKGLSLQGEWGVNYINSNDQSWRSDAIKVDGAIAMELKRNTIITNYNAFLNYSRNFGLNHEVSAVMGVENTRNYSHLTDLTGTGLNGIFHEIGTPTSLSGSSGLRDEVYLRGFFLRANYKFKNRYIVNASARRDGISKFTPDNRWANFFAGGLGWIVSEESWFPGSFVNFLKLRGSVGQTGNTNIPDGITSDSWEVASGPSNSLEGYNSSWLMTIGNPDIKWETTLSVDAGVDFGLLDNRINGSVAYYRQNVKDMLLAVSLPESAGIYGGNICWENIGAMYNQGVELEAMANLVSKRDFSWNLGFNLSYNKNKVTSLDPDSDRKGTGILNASQDDHIIRTIIKSGIPYGTYYMSEYAGVDSQKGIPLIYEVETSEDGSTRHTGKIIPATTENMSTNIMILEGKSALPKLVGGFNTTLNFKGFDLYALFSFATGHYIYSRVIQSAMTPNACMLVMNKKLLSDSWKEPGDKTDIPQINAACVYYYDNDGNQTSTAVPYGSENKTPSTRFLEKADFLKLRNLSLGYTLPSSLTERYGLQRVRLYLSASNLFTLTPFSGYDSEIAIEQSTGSALESFTAMPSSRIYTFGINLNF